MFPNLMRFSSRVRFTAIAFKLRHFLYKWAYMQIAHINTLQFVRLKNDSKHRFKIETKLL